MDYLFLPHLFRIGGDISRSGCLRQIVHGIRIRAPIQRAIAVDLSSRFLGQEMEPDGDQHPPSHGVPAHTGCVDGDARAAGGDPDGGHEHVHRVGIYARTDLLLPGAREAHVRGHAVLPPPWSLPLR